MLTVPQSWTSLSAVTPDLSFAYCQLDADYGLNCKSTNETAWFYNRTSGACETFTFGGCLGNQNRFLSQSICHSVCVLRSIGPSHGPPASTLRDHTRRTVTARLVATRSTQSTTTPDGSMLASATNRKTPSSTLSTTCIELDCAGKNCSVSGFATDAFGCTLCICADPCEVSVSRCHPILFQWSYAMRHPTGALYAC